jgi:hypothetical protein
MPVLSLLLLTVTYQLGQRQVLRERLKLDGLWERDHLTDRLTIVRASRNFPDGGWRRGFRSG